MSRTASILVPTFERHEVLVETLERIGLLTPPPLEVIVVDQSPSHPAAVEAALLALETEGWLRRIGRAEPSIPGAMNDALIAARGDIVIYCDDDVVPAPNFVEAHLRAHERHQKAIVGGQVLQPGELPEPLEGDRFAFRSTLPQSASEVIGCNFSVPRDLLLEIGGFDENFVAAAYRYERELCARALRAGFEVRFEPDASLAHLRAERGGTRAWGDHLRTAHPGHAVGEYYFLLRSHRRPGRWLEIALRPLRAIRTRHHLRRPWWIPVTLAAEVVGLGWAALLAWRGPSLLPHAGGLR